jgi:hypothetical protein
MGRSEGGQRESERVVDEARGCSVDEVGVLGVLKNSLGGKLPSIANVESGLRWTGRGEDEDEGEGERRGRNAWKTAYGTVT